MQTGSCHILLGADDDIGRWIASRLPPGFEEWITGGGRAIGFAYRGKLIAGVAYFRYNGASLEVAIASESARWMSRHNLWLIFAYPFEQLGVRRITAIANASNHGSRKLIETLGFQHEATLAQAAPDGDQIVYRMLRQDCRWILPDVTSTLFRPLAA